MHESDVLPRVPQRRFKDYDPGPPPAGHRLVLSLAAGRIAVSCACLKGSVPGNPRWCPPLAARRRWTAAEISAVFAAHVLYGDAG